MPAVASILLVDDDPALRDVLGMALEDAGHRVSLAADGREALLRLAERRVDLLVSDVNMPHLDGFSLCRRLRERGELLPVILLTSRDGEVDQALGLELGADDYVPKPYDLQELLARVRARLRALEGLKDVPDNFTFGDVRVDLRRRILVRGSDPEYRLTTHEAGVLGYLIAHRGRDVTREELLEKVWGYAPTMQTRTVDNQILKLRKKVEDEPADPRHILTIHGKGYRFEE